MIHPFDTAALAIAFTCALFAGTADLAADVEGSQDHPLIAQRYEGSEIIGYKQNAFDEYALLVQPATQYGGISKNLGATSPAP